MMGWFKFGSIFLFLLSVVSSAHASGDLVVHPLHHAMQLSALQNPFDEICKLAGPGISCAYHGFMIESDRISDPDAVVSEIHQGFPGKIRLVRKGPSRGAVEGDVNDLFGEFKASPGISMARFESLRSEISRAVRFLRYRNEKRFRGIFWSGVEHGNALMVFLPDERYGVTEVGLLTFGRAQDL
jgi:hypothetical protein